MGALDMVRRLFGGRGGDGGPAEAGGDATTAGAVEHNGFRIVPQPTRQGGGQFLTAGVIVHEGPAGRREHRFVRADTHATLDEAREFTIAKARRLIDEQGERLFQG